MSIAVRPTVLPGSPAKRLTTQLIMIAVVAMCLLPSRSFACDLVSTSSWFWTEAELVMKTPLIFVGQVVAVRPGTGDTFRADYEVEIVEPIKGAAPSRRVWLEQFAPPAAVALEQPQPRGRAIHGPDCKLWTAFTVGKRYLVFFGAFHPKGYELVADADDAWLKTVRSLARPK